MRPIGKIGICVAACLAGLPASGQDVPETPQTPSEPAPSLRQVMGVELLPTYENKTMEGIYNSYEAELRAGLKPETYTETHHDNATTLYDHRGRENYTIRGIYQIKKDQICYTYKTEKYWNGTYCFYVFTSNGCYYHFYEGSGFPKSEEDLARWDSMAYAKEDAQTCLPNIA